MTMMTMCQQQFLGPNQLANVTLMNHNLLCLQLFSPENDLHPTPRSTSSQLDIQIVESVFAGLGIDSYEWLTADIVSELYSQF